MRRMLSIAALAVLLTLRTAIGQVAGSTKETRCASGSR